MLAPLVQAGKLPAVEQRLPSDPLVLEPKDEIGQYSDTFVWATTSQTLGDLSSLNASENFLKWTRDTQGFRPNVLASYEWNQDGTEVTMHMRKGIRWSDGQPHTFDDYIFWWQDMVLDQTVKAVPPAGYSPDGKLMELQKIDDYTVKSKFAAPNPLFLQFLARATGNLSSYIQSPPAHYMKKFHPKYTPGADVQQLLLQFTNFYNTVERPQLTPWVLTSVSQGQRAILERNPYYWKVDPEGKQLPYFDRSEARIVQDGKAITALVLNGEIDYQFRNSASGPSDYSLLVDGQQRGGYTIDWWNRGNAGNGIIIHYDFPDKSIADLLWNQKFRQALSVAMDRKRINDIVWLGAGRVRQAAMPSDSAEFKTPRGQDVLKKWEQNWAQYDPALAAKLFDEIGVKVGSDGKWRTKPDGSPLELIVDVIVDWTDDVKMTQLAMEDWGKVGIKGVVNTIADTLASQRAMNGESMMWSRGNAAAGLLIAPGAWTPVESSDYIIIGPRYGLHFESNGTQGIKPPEGSFIEKLQKAYVAAIAEPTEQKRTEKLLDGYQVHIDDGPINFGWTGELKYPVARKNWMRNTTPTGYTASTHYSQPNSSDPEQWFKKA